MPPVHTETLTLPPNLDVASLRPLLEALRDRRGAPLVLDGSAVQRVGGLGLQILLSTRGTWLADQQPLSLIEASPALQEACALAGVASLES